MKIPYAVSNFGTLRREGYFYVDKTPFLPVLEQLGGRYLLFLRPRRMGKSLFVSLLAHYYDLDLADQFDALFQGLWVHQNPTPERNRYVILSFDFSQVGVDGGPDVLRRTFFENARTAARDVTSKYRRHIPELTRFEREIDRYDSADALIAELMATVRRAGREVYVLIDEYDNFANRLLSGGQQEAYDFMSTKTGFVRSFYAALKAGTTSGAVGRIFMTGVTPLLLDDVSSGFNIATHVSMSPRVNALAGFTQPEVERALDEFLAARPHIAAQPDLGNREALLRVLERYYNGYRFSTNASERVFNSDMTLYFLKELDDQGSFPTELLDPNVRTDYAKLQRIASLASAGADTRREILETILTEGGITSELVRQFGVKRISTSEAFVSLLYYMGLLTLAEQAPSVLLRLEIPNRVIHALEWEHFATMLAEQYHLSFDDADFKTAVETMVIAGDIQPFLDLFHTRVVKAVGNKDLRRFDEKSLKLMMLAILSLSPLIHPLSEKEFSQGYCDLFLGVSPRASSARFAWLLELKYLPSDAKGPRIDRAFSEAREQAARYAADDRLVPLLTRGHGLKVGSLVFIGAKKVMFRPWPGGPPAKGTVADDRAPSRGTRKRTTAPRAKKNAVTARAKKGIR